MAIEQDPSLKGKGASGPEGDLGAQADEKLEAGRDLSDVTKGLAHSFQNAGGLMDPRQLLPPSLRAISSLVESTMALGEGRQLDEAGQLTIISLRDSVEWHFQPFLVRVLQREPLLGEFLRDPIVLWEWVLREWQELEKEREKRKVKTGKKEEVEGFTKYEVFKVAWYSHESFHKVSWGFLPHPFPDLALFLAREEAWPARATEAFMANIERDFNIHRDYHQLLVCGDRDRLTDIQKQHYNISREYVGMYSVPVVLPELDIIDKEVKKIASRYTSTGRRPQELLEDRRQSSRTWKARNPERVRGYDHEYNRTGRKKPAKEPSSPLAST